MKSILDYNLESLRSLMEKIGDKPFRADQIYNWIYNKGVLDPDSMSNLPNALQDRLRRDFYFKPFDIVEVQKSRDGSKKVLLSDKVVAVEVVAIPTSDSRTTFCISTQCGCPFGCLFCATGGMGFKRNLTSGEMVYQVLALEKETSRPDNIVLMGMGEPLLNPEETGRFIEIMSDPDGYAMSERRVTISTSGLIKQLKKFHSAYPKVEIAISLNASDNQTRKKLMPHPSLASFDEIIQSIPSFNTEVTLEYVMIANINDSPKDAENLSRVIGNLSNVKINLIAFNQTSDKYRSTNAEKIIVFQNIFRKRGIRCFIRRSAGSDISAACGQLAGKRRK